VRSPLLISRTWESSCRVFASNEIFAEPGDGCPEDSHPSPLPEDWDNERLQIGGRRALYQSLLVEHIINSTTMNCTEG